jgi:hypothetical protein
MIFRALKAVRLLTRIRQERPDLFRAIVEFERGRDKLADMMAEVEHDYRDLFEGNLPRKTQ